MNPVLELLAGLTRVMLRLLLLAPRQRKGYGKLSAVGSCTRGLHGLPSADHYPHQ